MLRYHRPEAYKISVKLERSRPSPESLPSGVLELGSAYLVLGSEEARLSLGLNPLADGTELPTENEVHCCTFFLRHPSLPKHNLDSKGGRELWLGTYDSISCSDVHSARTGSSLTVGTGAKYF